MQILPFRCELPNGIHARPASAIEQKTACFQSDILLFNKSKLRQANAKSVLALVGADVAVGDECYFTISGDDENLAYEKLKVFIEQEFIHCDGLMPKKDKPEQGMIPIYLSWTSSQIIQGYGVSQGIAKGRAIYMKSFDLQKISLLEPSNSQSEQCEILKRALQSARQQFSLDIQQADKTAVDILEAQSQLLDDEDIEACLLEPREANNAIAALSMAIEELSLPFRSSSNEYLRQRELDIKDLGLRIARHLGIESKIQLPKLTEDSIIICQGLLTPSELLALRGEYLQGIVMASGAETSHTAILAQSFSLPLICLSSSIIESIQSAHILLLDTQYDLLIIEPDTYADNWFKFEKDKLSRLSISANTPKNDYSVLDPSLIFLDERMESKEEVIKRLTDNLEVNHRTDSGSQVEQAIWQREEIFSTALGFSIAIPHCKSPFVKHSSISVLRLPNELAWGDNVNVKLVIMLTINYSDENQHMRIFSVLARKLMHESFRNEMLNAKKSEDIVELLKLELEL
ncbi:fructose PTS transporter subunit IIA [Providencia rettgeri]|uniref:fructose PTS transporter subunit IIA n=1 Tax=Providencia rettgeri TaxID=587 RepID=UPI001657AF8F|nr:PTS sugar transporter subunit IIA [Providencia rettgeri]